MTQKRNQPTSITCFGSIQIIGVPDGEAPEWVRKRWVGVIVPVVGITTSLGIGTVSNKPSDSDPAFMVLQSVALEHLIPDADDAHEWWTANGFPQSPDACFGFKIKQCRIISPLKLEPSQSSVMKQFLGLEEVGVGAHDHPANQRA